jgi:hypothetical protein
MPGWRSKPLQQVNATENRPLLSHLIGIHRYFSVHYLAHGSYVAALKVRAAAGAEPVRAAVAGVGGGVKFVAAVYLHYPGLLRGIHKYNQITDENWLFNSVYAHQGSPF